MRNILSVHFAALLAALSVNAQTHWEFVNLEWFETADFQNEFLGIYSDYEVAANGTDFTGQEVASTDFADLPPFSGVIRSGNGVNGLDFSDEDADMETGFFSRSGNYFLGTGPVLEEIGNLRQSAAYWTAFRVTPSVTASPAGNWEGLQIEIGIAEDGRLSYWGYELYLINFPGSNTINFHVAESTTSPEDVGEQFQFTFSVQDNHVLVDTGDGTADLSMSASGDLMWTREIEDEDFGVDLLNNTFMQPVNPGSLSMQDVVGAWAMGELSLEAGGLNTQFPWRTMSTRTGLIDLRGDGSGSYYRIRDSIPREYFDSEDVVTHFNWGVDGSHIVITIDGEDPFEITVASSKEYARVYSYEDEGDRRELSFEQLIRIDGPIHPAVRSIPMFTPATGPWGEFMDQGWMYIAEWPWVYTNILGWQHMGEGNGRIVWVYDLQLGWLRTDYDMFPWFYGTGSGEIYYVHPDSTAGSRKIYSVHGGVWVE